MESETMSNNSTVAALATTPDPADHLDLVASEARIILGRRRRGPIEDSDEYIVGCVGLMRAAKNWDGRIPFRCCASMLIRWEILESYRVARRPKRNAVTCEVYDREVVDHRRSDTKDVDDRDEVEFCFKRVTAADRERLYKHHVDGMTQTDIGLSEHPPIGRRVVRKRLALSLALMPRKRGIKPLSGPEIQNRTLLALEAIC
jgi:DNA-directed RNA polymerase specialized sigma24 family protein